MASPVWTLNPSDLAFLWEECRRCFYLAAARGFPRPRSTMPGADARILDQMKAGLGGCRTPAIATDMPAGLFEFGERLVESQAIDVHLPDTVYRCRIRGTLDMVVRLDDGGYAVVDFRVGEGRAEHAFLYGRPLQASAYALEQPAPGVLALGPITRLGLLVVAPEKFTRDSGDAGVLGGGLSWIEIPRDDGALFGFLAEVLGVLERPEPPGGAALCPWCVYRDASRRTGL